MEDKIKGIALLLFGILLSCAQDGLNDTIFASMSDIPFAFVGLCVGIAGLCLVFGKSVQTAPCLISGIFSFSSSTMNWKSVLSSSRLLLI